MQLKLAATVLLSLGLISALNQSDAGTPTGLGEISFEDAFTIFQNHMPNFAPYDPQGTPYGVLIDCGRDSTQVHIYGWESSMESDYQQSEVPEPRAKEFPRGLKSFAKESDDEIKSYIQHLLYFVDDVLSGSFHKHTALVALVPKNLPERILNIFKAHIRDSYTFGSVVFVRQEPVYQWVTKNRRILSKRDTDSQNKAYGLVDIDPDNVRVTYDVATDIYQRTVDSLTNMRARLAYASFLTAAQGQTSAPLSQQITFEGLGTERARGAYQDLLIYKFKRSTRLEKLVRKSKCILGNCYDFVKGDEVLEIDDPCAPTGYYSSESLRPAAALESAGLRLNGSEPEPAEPHFRLRLRGTGSYNRCKSLLEDLVKYMRLTAYNCNGRLGKPVMLDFSEPACATDLLGEYFIPFRQISMLASGEIESVAQQSLKLEGVYDVREMRRKTKDLCNTNFSKLTDKTDQFNAGTCFKAVWIDTLLSAGLRMPENYNRMWMMSAFSENDL